MTELVMVMWISLHIQSIAIVPLCPYALWARLFLMPSRDPDLPDYATLVLTHLLT